MHSPRVEKELTKQSTLQYGCPIVVVIVIRGTPTPKYVEQGVVDIDVSVFQNIC